MGLICDGNTNYGLALEFCSGGPLNLWLKHHPGVLSLQLSIEWSLQVASGMEYLHKYVNSLSLTEFHHVYIVELFVVELEVCFVTELIRVADT